MGYTNFTSLTETRSRAFKVTIPASNRDYQSDDPGSSLENINNDQEYHECNCSNTENARHAEGTDQCIKAKKMDPERTKNLNLQLAVLLGDAQAIRECIASGATVAVADAFGNTFLHHVSKRGHWRAARVLLEAKVDPNAANKRGQTPLHLAARSGNGKMVELLIKNGAHVQVLDSRGHTPLQFASQCRRDKVSCLLYKNRTTDTKMFRPKRLKKMVSRFRNVSRCSSCQGASERHSRLTQPGGCFLWAMPEEASVITLHQIVL
ncbi:ankyrin-2-like [Penaeus japonicus]|uniref:ankyrin-2-like n=1 Tax=Penaeus japonicus TaxID=27405 RepID=UPI001C7104B5|nr:ankyrin-2-like [Penaeus japonicus]